MIFAKYTYPLPIMAVDTHFLSRNLLNYLTLFIIKDLKMASHLQFQQRLPMLFLQNSLLLIHLICVITIDFMQKGELKHDQMDN